MTASLLYVGLSTCYPILSNNQSINSNSYNPYVLLQCQSYKSSIMNKHVYHVIINSHQTSHILTHIAYYVTYNHILDSIILSCHIKLDSMSLHLSFVLLDSALRIKRYAQNRFLTLQSTHNTSNQ